MTERKTFRDEPWGASIWRERRSEAKPARDGEPAVYGPWSVPEQVGAAVGMTAEQAGAL